MQEEIKPLIRNKGKHEEELGIDQLVLMDFSIAAYNALKCAIQYAKYTRGTIRLLHISNQTESEEAFNPSKAALLPEEQEGELERSRKRLISLAEIISQEGVVATWKQVIGEEPKTGLKTAVATFKPDMIVLGKKKKRFNQIDRETNYLLRNYEGALLIVEEEQEVDLSPSVVVASDLKTEEEYDLSIAKELNQGESHRLTLLHVSKEPANGFAQWKAKMNTQGGVTCVHERSATIVKGVLNYIQHHNPGLLCLGRGNVVKSKFSRFFGPASTTVELIKQSPIPVLILPR